MKLYVDKNQQKGKHELKHRYFEHNGYELVFLPLPEGDYVLENPKIERVRQNKASRGCDVTKNDISGLFDKSVDTKQHIQELIQDVIQSHDRFRDELIRAQDKGVQLYILVENEDGVKKIDDLFRWDNPRLKESPRATTGLKLYKIMKTMQQRYDIEFMFCDKNSTGSEIVRLLRDSRRD